jgi:hypothetical protein
MAAPPPKKPQPEGLAEVERALSVLQGRHPEHERARREDQERRAARQAELDAKAAVETKRVAKRRLLGSVLAVAGVSLAIAIAVVFKAELARRGRLEQAADPYRAMGFAVVETSGRGNAKLEAATEAGCLLVATTSASDVRLQVGEAVVEGAAPLLTCTCEAGTATASAKAAEGVVLLRADTGTIGGSRAFGFLPFTPRKLGLTDSACADASLDAWIESKRYVTAESPEHVRAFVPASGAPDARFPPFKQLSVLKPEAPFVIVEGPANACIVLVPKTDDRVALLAKTLLIPFANERSGLCYPNATTFLVKRQGASGDIDVLVAPADRVGGTAGTRELAHANTITAPADRGWDAKQLLVASAVPDSIISTAIAPDIAPEPEARIVALSLDGAQSIASDAADGVYSFCDPPVDRATNAVCAFSGPQKWHGAAGGIARAKLPFWLFGMQNVVEPAALKIETQLLALARRLRGDGFEPTTMEAVTETDKGAEVLGRANEDAMVVVALSPTAPWAFPLSDGPAWTLDQSPRIVPIAPLARIQVTTPLKLPPKGARRTVVFRRRTAP